MGCTVETRQLLRQLRSASASSAPRSSASAPTSSIAVRFANDNKRPSRSSATRTSASARRSASCGRSSSIPQRITFVVDEEGVVRAVFHHEVQISRHLDDVREFLETRASRRATSSGRRRRGGAGGVAPAAGGTTSMNLPSWFTVFHVPSRIEVAVVAQAARPRSPCARAPRTAACGSTSAAATARSRRRRRRRPRRTCARRRWRRARPTPRLMRLPMSMW